MFFRNVFLQVLACALTTLTSFHVTAEDQQKMYSFFENVDTVIYTGLFSDTKIKVGHSEPRPGMDKANLIYLHGFADTMDNHQELLERFHQAGLRVIAFDYPGHGQSEGWIWTWTLRDVADILHDIVTDPTINLDPNLPVILAGWSTGATMALRIAQKSALTGESWMTEIFPALPSLAGLILFAPGLPVNTTVGDRLIFPDAKTLSRNPNAFRNRPSPSSTLEAGAFTLSLKTQSVKAMVRSAELPKNLPTLILVGGDPNSSKDPGDMYADSRRSVRFVRTQMELGRNVFGLQCPGAYHALEFEPDGIGEGTQKLAVQFALTILADPEESRRNIAHMISQTKISACPVITPEKKSSQILR